MKKVLLFFVICCMVLNTMGMSVFAASAEVEFSMSDVKDMIAELGTKLEAAEAADRSAGFLVAKEYLKTDDGIDTLIEVIDGGELSTDPRFADIYTVIGDITTRKDQFVFALKLFKCFTEDERETVLDRFYARESIEFTDSEKADIEDIYGYFNDGTTISALEGGNSVTGEMIASLFTIFDGNIMLTDKSFGSENFKLKSITNSFKTKVNNVLEEYSIGDETYTAESFFNIIIDGVNDDFTDGIKEKIKNVFGTVGIYEPAKKSSSNDSSSSSSGPDYTSSGTTDDSQYGTQTPGTIFSPAELLSQHAVAGQPLVGFDDTVGHWSDGYTTYLKHMGILVGDAGTNNFRPDWKINREEMAVLMMRVLALRDGVDASNATHITYLDEADISPWAINSISYLTPLKILKGYPDGTYMPKKEITREEAVAIISRVVNNRYKPTTTSADYADHSNIGDWAKWDVNYTSSLGIVKGYTTGEFLPKNYITRAEVAVLIYNLLGVEGLLH